MKNQDIANILFDVADLLEIQGVDFKPRAYRRAAQNIEKLSEDITVLFQKNELKKIPGIGSNIAIKIQEILETGRLSYLEKLRETVPKELIEMMNIEGLGPKSIQKIHTKLHINNIEELESALKQKKIRNLEGFGEKSEQNLLQSLLIYRKSHQRFLLGKILPIAREIEKKLKSMDEVLKISISGSIRRKKETIGDLDMLLVSNYPSKIVDTFTQLYEIKHFIAKGKTKVTVMLKNGLQVDLRIVDEESFGSALQYFTGSKEHNIKLRNLASSKNWKLNEYGLFDKKTNKKIAGKDEQNLYNMLGLNYIEPELRENRGEIEASINGEIPKLVELNEIKGDLHIHTNWSDGLNSIEEMGQAAKNLGYEYIAITDHSKGLRIAHGLSEDDLIRQLQEINRINHKIDNFTILSGVEANIDKEGNLDINKNILKDLDFVIASIHYGFKDSEKKMTDRILTAMHNEFVSAIGHPTGRIIYKRDPYQINLEKIFETAKELGILLEINAFPNRLDLSDINCYKAKNSGVKVCLGTDAHNINHLRNIELGIFTARRGWLVKDDVINTMYLKDLKKELKI